MGNFLWFHTNLGRFGSRKKNSRCREASRDPGTAHWIFLPKYMELCLFTEIEQLFHLDDQIDRRTLLRPKWEGTNSKIYILIKQKQNNDSDTITFRRVCHFQSNTRYWFGACKVELEIYILPVVNILSYFSSDHRWAANCFHHFWMFTFKLQPWL